MENPSGQSLLECCLIDWMNVQKAGQDSDGPTAAKSDRSSGAVFTQYVILVHDPLRNKAWCVCRRYSEFRDLFKTDMRSHLSSANIRFPEKRTIDRLSESVIAERFACFVKMMGLISMNPVIQRLSVVSEFLGLSDMVSMVDPNTLREPEVLEDFLASPSGRVPIKLFSRAVSDRYEEFRAVILHSRELKRSLCLSLSPLENGGTTSPSAGFQNDLVHKTSAVAAADMQQQQIVVGMEHILSASLLTASVLSLQTCLAKSSALYLVCPSADAARSLADQLEKGLANIRTLERMILAHTQAIRFQPFDAQNPAHRALVLELFVALKPEAAANPPAEKDARWAEIGFQGKDPATDFRSMGLPGLKQLLYIAAAYPQETQAIVASAPEYPFACSCLNISKKLFDAVASPSTTLVASLSVPSSDFPSPPSPSPPSPPSAASSSATSLSTPTPPSMSGNLPGDSSSCATTATAVPRLAPATVVLPSRIHRQILPNPFLSLLVCLCLPRCDNDPLSSAAAAAAAAVIQPESTVDEVFCALVLYLDYVFSKENAGYMDYGAILKVVCEKAFVFLPQKWLVDKELSRCPLRTLADFRISLFSHSDVY